MNNVYYVVDFSTYAVTLNVICKKCDRKYASDSDSEKYM